jgi:hypothetical protein
VLLADLQAVLAELLFDAAAVGVEGEIALWVRPADLAAADGQVTEGPPAIGGDDRRAAGEQVLGAFFVAVGLDSQDLDSRTRDRACARASTLVPEWFREPFGNSRK